MKRLTVSLALSLTFAFAAHASDRIVTDSPVVQSLVAGVTGSIPGALMAPGADPHHMQLRPSQARDLARADYLIWIGPEFSPWLDEATLSINPDVVDVRLGEADAHAWLDPEVAQAWADRVADVLGISENSVDLSALQTALEANLSALKEVPLLVGHDAYSAFAKRFGLNVVDAIADGHAAPPGAAHLSALKAAVEAEKVGCIVMDSTEIADYVGIISGGSDVPVVTVDLSGLGLEPGVEFYGALMLRLSRDLQGCLR